MASTISPVKVDCSSCRRKTSHKIIHQHVERGDSEYDFVATHAIVECLGCQHVAFWHQFEELEHAYPISNTEWEVPTTSQVYPKVAVQHNNIERTWSIPEIVRDIYNETVSAIQEDALTLASLGLRATIEAVCNEQEISGRDLKSRITKLANQGLISKQDSERLHAIRFLGNDAAHEIKAAKPQQISVALKIVQHLLQSLYLLEDEALGKLDTLIGNYDEFLALLGKNIRNFESGSELPIAAFLAKDMRRIDGNLPDMESKLKEDIDSGDFDKLKVGKMDKYANSKDELAHFIKV